MWNICYCIWLTFKRLYGFLYFKLNSKRFSANFDDSEKGLLDKMPIALFYYFLPEGIPSTFCNIFKEIVARKRCFIYPLCWAQPKRKISLCSLYIIQHWTPFSKMILSYKFCSSNQNINNISNIICTRYTSFLSKNSFCHYELKSISLIECYEIFIFLL